jgi:AraC family transcriptional regulator
MDISKGNPGSAVTGSNDDAGSFVREVENPSASAMSLLETAAEVMQDNPNAAMACIVRATDLLRTDPGALDRHADRVTTTMARGGLAPWQMHGVAAHIDNVMESKIRLHDCAKIVRLSGSHFARAFKISFGESFARHVAACRVERAQQLMLRTNDPLSDIALACGFADQPHLTRVFRNRVGQSPAAWRWQRLNLPPRHEHRIGESVDAAA